LKTACTYATTWPLDTKLAVNLSPAQFKTQDVYGLVRRVLTETGLEPERLELEITEGIILQNTDAVLDTLTRLDQLGVSIAMDDFGTGSRASPTSPVSRSRRSRSTARSSTRSAPARRPRPLCRASSGSASRCT
jgi:predicted signal transduction protein with EAL and GGDEF domain